MADDAADETADEGGAEGDHASVRRRLVDHGRWRRRGRRSVMVARRMVVRRRAVVRGRIASAVMSAARCREAGSSERQAGEDRSDDFDFLVHITPSLSFLLLCAFRAYVKQGALAPVF